MDKKILIKFYFAIAEALEQTMLKGYTAGNLQVARLNRKKLKFAELPPDNIETDLFSIDYNAYDDRVLQNFRVECFTVAGVETYELEEELKKLAEDILTGKEDTVAGNPNADKLEIFKTLAKEVIEKYVPVENVKPGHRLKTNLQMAVTSANAAANYIRLQPLNSLYTHYRYNTQGDNRVRPKHALLDGRVWRADDPIWATIWPPVDWGCRCPTPTPLTSGEAKELNVESSKGDAKYIKDLHSEAGIPPEFQRNPGIEKSIWSKWLDSKLSGMPDSITNYELQITSDDALKFKEAELIQLKDYAGYRVYFSAESNNGTTKKEVLNCIKNPAEVWGSIKKLRKGERSSTVNYLIEAESNWYVVSSVNANIIVYGADKPDEFRKGVRLK